MTEEVLQRIKEDYEKRRKQKEQLSKALEEITKLEEDPNVKKYLKLKRELNKLHDYKSALRETDAQMLSWSFYAHQYMMKTTNDIYLCMGTFIMDHVCDIEHGPSDIRLNRDDPRAEYRIYKNIENGYSKQVAIRKCDEFERNHKVIIPKTTSAERYYYELQREFINTAITEGQEIACRKILSKGIK